MSLMSFKSHTLSESKNLHMEHLEDIIYNEGSSGVDSGIAFLESITDMLGSKASSSTNITVKWDGAPAIFAGIHPETKKFFVATKSLFNKNAKINYTNADIAKNHSGGLASRLKIALASLPKLGIKTILQGDMMFAKGDIATKKIDGEAHYTFKPNTITYAVPVNSDMGKRINSAKMGIVWHTEYKGRDISSLKASFAPSIKSLRQTKDVWFDNANFKDTSGSSTMTKEETKEMRTLIKNIESARSKAGNRFIDSLADVESPTTANQNITYDIKTFMNQRIREGSIDVNSKDFTAWVEGKMQDKIDSVKTDAAKERKRKSKDDIVGFMTKNNKKMDSVFSLHAAMSQAKIYIVRRLERAKSIGTFIQTSTGFKVTAPEGFVAIDKPSNRAYKLVDRLEFSRQNFNAAKNWVKG